MLKAQYFAGHLVRLDLTNFGLSCDFPMEEMAAFQYVTEMYFQGNAMSVSKQPFYHNDKSRPPSLCLLYHDLSYPVQGLDSGVHTFWSTTVLSLLLA